MKHRSRVLLLALCVGWGLAPSCNVAAPAASVSGLGTLFDGAVDGTLAVTASVDTGLAFIDLSDPHAPVVVGTLDLPDAEYAVDLAGGLAYVLESRGLGGHLSIVDPAEPADPQLLSRTPIPGLLTPGGLTARDGFLYIATTTEGLQIVDIADPTEPVIVATLPTTTKAAGISLSGDRAVVATDSGDVLFADLSSPLDPAAFWEASLSAETAALAGDIFISVLSNSTQIIDVSVPTAPTLRALIGISANDALPSGTELYFGTDAGVSRYDLSDPRQPRLVAEVATPGPVVAVAKQDAVVLAADSGGTLTVILSF